MPHIALLIKKSSVNLLLEALNIEMTQGLSRAFETLVADACNEQAGTSYEAGKQAKAVPMWSDSSPVDLVLTIMLWGIEDPDIVLPHIQDQIEDTLTKWYDTEVSFEVHIIFVGRP